MNWLTPWWSDFGAFVQMGKHGAYVWPAFGVCALALAGEWCALKKQAARVRGAAGVDAPLLLPLGEGMDGGPHTQNADLQVLQIPNGEGATAT